MQSPSRRVAIRDTSDLVKAEASASDALKFVFATKQVIGEVEETLRQYEQPPKPSGRQAVIRVPVEWEDDYGRRMAMHGESPTHESGLELRVRAAVADLNNARLKLSKQSERIKKAKWKRDKEAERNAKLRAEIEHWLLRREGVKYALADAEEKNAQGLFDDVWGRLYKDALARPPRMEERRARHFHEVCQSLESIEAALRHLVPRPQERSLSPPPEPANHQVPGRRRRATVHDGCMVFHPTGEWAHEIL
mmetsp:Transcript_34762/g.84035  ORF Transcript_34762/g.84035 Transcript_34762/m.84035 type:complete len:250 (+) Transcript_34762:44-793(+)